MIFGQTILGEVREYPANFCALALYVQCAVSQCTSQAAVAADLGIIEPAGLAAPGLSALYGLAEPAAAIPYSMAAPCAWCAPAMDFTPISGGGLPVSSFSAIAPVGLAVISENAYECILVVTGELPFLGTVAVEGMVPSAGAGAVNHACGNGINAMVSETVADIAPDFANPGYAGPSFAALCLGYHAGWADRSCGYAL